MSTDTDTTTATTPMEQITVYDDHRGHMVRFTGRLIGHEDRGSTDVWAYMTTTGPIRVVDDRGAGTVESYDDYAEFREAWERQCPSLVAQVAEALGEDYAEDLD